MPYLIYLKGHYDDWPTNLAICYYIDDAREVVKKLNDIAEKFLIDNIELIKKISESNLSNMSEEDLETVDNNLKNVKWPIEMDKDLDYHTIIDDIYHGKPKIRGFNFVELQGVGKEPY